MAQYYDANEVSERLKKQLEICKWQSVDNGRLYEIELPVVLYFNYQRLRLYIYPVDDGYYISDDGQTFSEYSGDTLYYYELFDEEDKNYHYEILQDNNYLYKKYKFDYSLMSAMDEFVRFFIFLDEFMNKNNII